VAELDTITCKDAAAWDAWLAANHGLHRGVWLKIAKKDSGVASVTNDEAVDVGLCWGWISGHRRGRSGRDQSPERGLPATGGMVRDGDVPSPNPRSGAHATGP
jgi:uncharacterized protein YdeI (YjbR/CyaY-like superfamily)